MRLGVRGKLFAVSLLVMLVVGLASGLFLEGALKGWLNARIEGELLRQARVARDLLDLSAPAATIAALDPVADRVGASTGARITIISAGGEVLGDSELDAHQLEGVENHGQRPEVLAALQRDHGVARRYSTTVRTEMLYVALPFHGSSGEGVMRAALPLSEVDQAVDRLRLVLLLAALLGVGVAVFMSGFASHLTTRAIRRLMESARAVVKGEGARRLSVTSTDEIGGLAGSFNRVVEDLDRTMTTLAGERDHLETILDSLTEGVLAVDSEHRVSRVNRAALDLLDLRSSPLGESLVEVARVPALVELAASDSIGSDEAEVVELELSGSRHVEARTAPLRAGGHVVVLRDVTRTRRLERIRRDFVANVSHELRTPVSVIRANAETLLDGGVDDDRERGRAFLDAIHRNANRLSHIIADLLDLSRIEAGEYELNLGVIELQPVVRRVVGGLNELARGRKIKLDLDVPDGMRVRADSHALEQVLVNLVDNAVKYSSEEGDVLVRAVLTDRSVRIEVADNGPGIELRHRKRVFERFYRVDPGRSREMGGTGLGLSIVKHLVERMAGQVGVEPNLPHGSVFWLALPLAS